MELSTGRLEPSTRIAEHSSGHSAEERRQRAPRRRPNDLLAGDDLLTDDEPVTDGGLPTEDRETHTLDDIA